MLAFVVGILAGFGLSVLILGFFAVLAEEDEKRQSEAHARKLQDEYNQKVKTDLESWYRAYY